jgi:hypothetical protein
MTDKGLAPVPRKKEGRAARLAALEKDGTTTTASPEMTATPELCDGAESSPTKNCSVKNEL